MEQIFAYIDTYGLLVVIAGLLASMLCGCIKIPIVKAIKKKNLGEKATSNRITTVCTLIVAIFSILIIVAYTCIKAHSFAPLMTVELYSDILLAITFAKIAYMLYEGVGEVSIKKWMHQLFTAIAEKARNNKASTVQDYVDIVQSVLTDTLHMPLTDAQKETLKQSLKKQAPVTEEKQEETDDGEKV